MYFAAILTFVGGRNIDTASIYSLYGGGECACCALKVLRGWVFVNVSRIISQTRQISHLANETTAPKVGTRNVLILSRDEILFCNSV